MTYDQCVPVELRTLEGRGGGILTLLTDAVARYDIKYNKMTIVRNEVEVGRSTQSRSYPKHAGFILSQSKFAYSSQCSST